MSFSNMTVTPRIIILEEEEFRQTGVTSDMLSMQGGDTEFGVTVDPVVAGKASRIARNIARHPVQQRSIQPSGPERSVADIRRQNELDQVRQADEAQEFFQKGLQAESANKAGVAKIYYQMAARRATGELLQQVTARLSLLESSRLAGR
jgi:hypothetical protein